MSAICLEGLDGLTIFNVDLHLVFPVDARHHAVAKSVRQVHRVAPICSAT
jgi:hypothetical protein